jgi:hypothetical protein
MVQPAAVNMYSAANIIGNEPIIHETYDRINMVTEPPQMGLGSLVHNVGRFVNDGMDMITELMRWLNHMKENW